MGGWGVGVQYLVSGGGGGGGGRGCSVLGVFADRDWLNQSMEHGAWIYDYNNMKYNHSSMLLFIGALAWTHLKLMDGLVIVSQMTIKEAPVNMALILIV